MTEYCESIESVAEGSRCDYMDVDDGYTSVSRIIQQLRERASDIVSLRHVRGAVSHERHSTRDIPSL